MLNGIFTMRFRLSSPSCILGFSTPTTSKLIPFSRIVSPSGYIPENSFVFASEPITATWFALLHVRRRKKPPLGHLHLLDVL